MNVNAAYRQILLMEPRVAGALFGAVAAGQVRRINVMDLLAVPDGEEVDVSEYMAALSGGGYAVRNTAGVWRLTGDGEVKAAEYAVAALRCPQVLRLRAAWEAMGSALITLARGEPPTPEQLAAIPDAHRVYLLGHHARATQLGLVMRRYGRAVDAINDWLGTCPDRADGDGGRAGALRALSILRGDPGGSVSVV